MAGKKISELTGSTNPSMTGVTAVSYGGTTYKTTLSTLRQILVDSGSHRFTGSQYISGSLILTGSMPNLIVGSGTYHTDNPEILHVQNSGSFNIAHFEGNNEYYSQLNIKNTNSGNNSSTDLVLTADNGSESNHYIDLGINSSTYTGGLVGYENDSYLLNVGKDMYVGTVGGINHPSQLKLFSNNLWENPQITISGSRQIAFNTSSVSSGYVYEFSGSVKLQDELNVGGSVTSSYFVGDGSQLTNLPTPTYISSGLSAPGSSVVANDTDVDINFSGVGTRHTFTQNGMTTNGFTILSQVTSSFNDDVDAAAGGVPLQGLYRSGSFVMIRLT